MTKQQKKYAKAMTMLTLYLHLAQSQAEMIIADKMATRELKKKLRQIKDYCAAASGNIAAMGNMDKENVIDIAGEIDDIIRSAIIEENEQ